MLCGPEKQRIAEVQTERHQATLLTLAQGNHRSVRRSRKSLRMHCFHVMSGLAKQLGGHVPQVLVQFEIHGAASIGISI